MPEISRFFGIVINIFFDDHPPPHFHAEYGDHRAIYDIHRLAPLAGTLPPRAMDMVLEWASLHQHELLDNWNRAQSQESLQKIDPLD